MARPVRSETSISRSPSPPAHQVKIAAAWILRIVRRPSRAAPFAEIYLRPGGRGCVYVFAISGDGSRQTRDQDRHDDPGPAPGRRFRYRFYPTGPACVGAPTKLRGSGRAARRLQTVTSFLKSDSTSCVVSGSRGVGTLGDYGAYFNRAEKSVSLRATNLFRNLLWHALGTVTCPPLLSPAIESSCSHANRVMLRSVAKPLLESPLKRVHHKTQYP